MGTSIGANTNTSDWRGQDFGSVTLCCDSPVWLTEWLATWAVEEG